MKWSSALAVAAIAVLGVAAAAAMGLLANVISGDSIGLSAQPLRAGESLAPAAADGGRDRSGGAKARPRPRRRAATRAR